MKLCSPVCCFAPAVYIGQGHFQGLETAVVFDMRTFVRYAEMLGVLAAFFCIFSPCNKRFGGVEPALYSGKFMFLDIFDDCFETLGHPLVFMINQLLPDFHIHVGDIQIAKHTGIHQRLRYEIRQEGNHIAFGKQRCDHIRPANFQYR